MQKYKLILLAGIAIVIAIFFIFDLNDYFSLDYFIEKKAIIDTFYADNPVETGFIYFITYIVVTSLSLPGAGIMTLIGGAIFGLLWGFILVSFASSIGATIAFLLARFLFRDTVQNRFRNYLGPINEGIEKDGGFYLFTLRMVPIFPYFIINVLMALTPIRTLTFFLVTQIGMLPATAIFVNAGMQLAKIQSPGDILSPEIIGSLILLGVFPLAAKKLNELIKSRKPTSEDKIT